jgi:hypothetical protein
MIRRRHVGDLVPPSPELDPVEARRGPFAWFKARAGYNAAGFKNEARRATRDQNCQRNGSANVRFGQPKADLN